jgi:hypothetical protein
MPYGKQVEAAFIRVGGPTRVETALEASRFWLLPPSWVVTTRPVSAVGASAQVGGRVGRASASRSLSSKRRRHPLTVDLRWNAHASPLWRPLHRHMAEPPARRAPI